MAPSKLLGRTATGRTGSSAQSPLLQNDPSRSRIRGDDGSLAESEEDTNTLLGEAPELEDAIDEYEGRTSSQRRRQEVIRYTSYSSAILSCLCAGSITAYSLYGHLFLSRLKYTALQVNAVSIAAELAMYLPVPLFGYLCDRYNPALLSFMASIFFGVGYFLAAGVYGAGPPLSGGGTGWPFQAMVIAFVFVGFGTSCMYLSGVTTCAKNFGRGKHRGFALATPIAAFGLSGMWQSQIGSRLLFERLEDGTRGDVDVFRYFLFLGGTLLAVGLVGTVGLRIVDEEELIDEAVDELERSGLLEESAFFQRAGAERNYGAMADEGRPGVERQRSLSIEEAAVQRTVAEELKKREEEEEKRKKTWLLNAETRRFLSDHTMWWLAAGFFLVTGPGEAFINNLGTILGSLEEVQATPDAVPSAPQTSAATHVSIVAITSTVARIMTGTLSDLFAPTDGKPRRGAWKLSLPRPLLLIITALLLSAGQVLLASGYVQGHASPRFGFVSALIGAGYGAVFSLVPIIISVVWGVENFGTNWGVVAVMPAFGALVWGLLYSAVYQSAAGSGDDDGNRLCFGAECYASTFYAMAVSVWIACGLWLFAWRGSVGRLRGWFGRGVAV